jgi:hypothetical protein
LTRVLVVEATTPRGPDGVQPPGAADLHYSSGTFAKPFGGKGEGGVGTATTVML